MHSKFLRVPPLMSVLLAATTFVMSTPALADAVILRSAVTSLPVGTIVRNGQMLRVPDGGSVMLLLPNGQTRQLTGPLRERYAAIIPPAPSITGAFVAMFKARASNERLGGVRNGDPRCASNGPQDWNTIATEWNAGCRQEALEQLDARLK
jgi:hypothetical protein